MRGPLIKHILFAVFLIYSVCVSAYLSNAADPQSQRRREYSGPVGDGQNASGTHGLYEHSIDFSPDEQNVGYIWCHGSYILPQDLRDRPHTLTETLEIRIRSTSEGDDETRTPLCSVDCGSNGTVYYHLDAAVQFAPDSKHVAAICSRRMVLIDAARGTNRAVDFAGENFGSFAWQDKNTVNFSTYDDRSVRYWRWNITKPPESRIEVYKYNGAGGGVVQYLNGAFENAGGTNVEVPSLLQPDQWSPDGRFVSIQIPAGTNGWQHGILDMKLGTVKRYPFSLLDQSWKPDSSALLVEDYFELHIGDEYRQIPRLQVLDPNTGEFYNISKELNRLLGPGGFSILGAGWTADSKYAVFNRTGGYMIQPRPLSIKLLTAGLIHTSPIPGWLLLHEGDTFQWINYDGNRTAPIKGWPNDWRWSPHGHYAALIQNGKLEVFAPVSPPGVN